MKRKPKQPKPVKAWAVFGPGNRVPFICAPTQDAAQFDARAIVSPTRMSPWATLEAMGYTVQRVEIVPVGAKR